MYEDYKIFGPYSRKDKRQIVILEDANRNKITVSYPKFIVENFLGRKLDPNLETIDHIDGNFLNNDLANLRIISRSRHAIEDSVSYVESEVKCKWCNKSFILTKTQCSEFVHNKKNEHRVGPFCSKQCQGYYGKSIQLGLVSKKDFIDDFLPKKIKNKLLNKVEPLIRNNESGAGDIGEPLTDNADGNTEGTLL